MVNKCNIGELQNAAPQINLMAAASCVYGRAKRIVALQFALTVPAALASSIIMACQPSWKIWLTFFSVSVALLDVLCFSRAHARLKKRGASLQQMFDCAVFELPWCQFRCGATVDSEDVLAEATEHLRNPNARKPIADWYPIAVNALPLPLARLICQRASFWWDLHLRDRVRGTLVLILAVLASSIFLIALIRGNTVEQMILTVYIPLAPAIIWILREIFAQRDALKSAESGLVFFDTHWKQAMTGKLTDAELTDASVLMQHALFASRSRSPTVFNWVYNLLRPRQQQQMDHKAEELVEEALKRNTSGEP